jgi:outer membrane protein assembly factor BamB
VFALAFVVSMAVSLPAAATVQATTGDWAQFQGDSAHSGARPGGPAPPYRASWSIHADVPGGETLSAPVVAGSSVFVTSPESALAFDASSGAQVWKTDRNAPPVSPAVASVGGHPAVLFTTGRDAGSSRIVAVDAASGRPLWKSPPALKDESRSGVTVDADRAFVGDESGNVYAIDLAHGTVVWTGETPGRVAGPLAAADGVVVAVVPASDANRSTTIVALDEATGKERWNVTPDAAATIASLASIVDGNAVVAFADGSVLGLSLRDGTQAWSARIPALVSPFVAPAVGGGSVYLADSSGGVHRVTPAAGERWLFEFNESILRASPVLIGDAVVVGLEDGSVAAVDSSSGNLVFRTAAASSPVAGIAIAGGTLIVVRSGTGRPTITAYETDPSGRLVDEASPTIPVTGDLAVGFALAIAVGAVVFVPALLLGGRRRLEDPSALDGDEDDDGDRADDDEDDDPTDDPTDEEPE